VESNTTAGSLRARRQSWLHITEFSTLQNNPQHVRVLANEMMATRLGALLGLPVPRVTTIEVCSWLIANTPELRINLGGVRTAFQSGLHLASEYVVDPAEGALFDYLPESLFQRVRNIGDFARVLVLDKWTGNADGRQAVFTWSTKRRADYKAFFIDQGYCFNAGEWNFPDAALRGVYARNYVYQHVRGWNAFEPALTRVEEMSVDVLWSIAANVPAQWYENDTAGLSRLIETLHKRRSSVRDQITAFRHSTRDPFPNWQSARPRAVLQASIPRRGSTISPHVRGGSLQAELNSNERA